MFAYNTYFANGLGINLSIENGLVVLEVIKGTYNSYICIGEIKVCETLTEVHEFLNEVSKR